MKWLLDENIPEAATGWLSDRNVEATHLRYTEKWRADDDSVVRWARGRFDAIVTRDSDFVRLVPIAPYDPLQLVHLRIGNASNTVFLTWLEERLSDILRRLENGDQYIEVR